MPACLEKFIQLGIALFRNWIVLPPLDLPTHCRSINKGEWSMSYSEKLQRGLRLVLCYVWAMMAVAFSGYVHAQDLGKMVTVDVPPQKVSTALIELSKQAGVQVIMPGTELDKLETQGVHGQMTLGEALSKLLQGTPLRFHETAPNTITVSSAGSSASPSDSTAVAQSGADSDIQAGVAPYAAQRSEAASQSAAGQTQELDKVVVTGSRLPRTAKEGAQEVKVYTKQQIEQSGQTTVADFLNTLPDVSLNTNEAFQTQSGGTTVQLHGLPIGTTLVLLNGQRVEASAVQVNSGFNIFDLNNVPTSAVERIEVVSEGSSAIYGSDAIAGVVNIVLRNNVNGGEIAAKYGWASGTQETNASAVWGKRWDHAALSVIASYQKRSPLYGLDRAVTANNDYTQYGGGDARLDACSLADIYSTNGGNLPGTNSPYAAVSQSSTVHNYVAVPGQLNKCSFYGYQQLLPETHRDSILVQGHYGLTSSVDVFGGLLYSHVIEDDFVGPPFLYGAPGYQQFTVSANNPYNPYGQTVGVSQLLSSLGNSVLGVPTATVFFRPSLGLKGTLFSDWYWETSGWISADRTQYAQTGNLDATATQAALNSSDPATALNPFIAGPPGTSQELRSLLVNYYARYRGQETGVNGFVRGPLLKLPSGAVDIVLGSEYDHDTFSAENINNPFATSGTYHRDAFSVFGEAHIPIVANHDNPSVGDRLALTVAGRYNHFDDFGSNTTPQYGVEFRPANTLLLRGTYSRSFKAPTLPDLDGPQTVIASTVNDPLLNNQIEAISLVSGSNPKLHPETGFSSTYGFVYSSEAIPDLQLSVTHWQINEFNNMQRFSENDLVQNENLFPNNVIRAASCPSGPPCPIVEIIDNPVNFGEINVAGLDYQVTYKARSEVGIWTPSLNATQTYRYNEALLPNSPPTDAASKAQDSGNWAPHWKATAALGWTLGPYSAHVDARYVGRYQDYDTTSHELGNFWLYDVNARYLIGQALAHDDPWLRGAYIEVGGVNISNSLPVYSDRNGGGYDPTQYDIRGRFLYALAGIKW